MSVHDYLEAVLRDQTLTSGSEELTKLQGHRKKVESLLRRKFAETSPTIRYGGSKAKGTMIKASFDLDMPCYFPHDETGAGETLQDIYANVQMALQEEYITDPKTSAIRLKDTADYSDFHIDVVPGRFVEGSDGDVFIFQSSAEKCRLKTNLDVHIAHIRDSGVTDAIRLVKLWREHQGLHVKTFVLELLVVELVKKRKSASLERQLVHIWTALRDRADELSVEDPANPAGNDLSSYLDAVSATLSTAAGSTLERVDADDWEAIFGPVEDESEGSRVVGLRSIAASVSTPHKPWCSGR